MRPLGAQVLAAVKKRWPELRTKTSLQYAPSSVDLPVPPVVPVSQPPPLLPRRLAPCRGNKVRWRLWQVDTWAQTYMDYYCEKPEDWNWRLGKQCAGHHGEGNCSCTSAPGNRRSTGSD